MQLTQTVLKILPLIQHDFHSLLECVQAEREQGKFGCFFMSVGIANSQYIIVMGTEKLLCLFMVGFFIAVNKKLKKQYTNLTNMNDIRKHCICNIQ